MKVLAKKYFTAIGTFIFIASVGFCQGHIVADPLNHLDEELVKQYSIYEVGVFPGAGINSKIKRFINGDSGSKINPFLEWEIKVVGKFHHIPSDSTIEIDGFYYEDQTSYMKSPLPKPRNLVCYTNEEYRELGGYKKNNDYPYPFLIRFAPPMSGEWECTVEVITPEDRLISSSHSFEVEKDENNGYTKVAKNGRYLERNEKSFIPVGSNAPWPLTSYRFDPEFANLNHVREGIALEEQYRPEFVKPRLYKKYRSILESMAQSGANSFRMIMYPSGTDIEWEELGNYSKRMGMAKELDSILMVAEKNNMYIHWNMQIHYSFQESEHAYYTQWSWDKEVNGSPFCYTTIEGVNKSTDFFLNETAKKYYKQRLRYILSRWGYSTNISLFELFSEISNVGTAEADASDFYRANENWKLSRDWQWEMAEYVKSHHNGRVHLLTGSYAGNIADEDDIYCSKNMDIMAANIYDFSEPSFSHYYWNKSVAGSALNEDPKNHSTYSIKQHNGEETWIQKPLFYSEGGPVTSESACPKNQLETNRSLWQSMFSGLAGCFSWNAWYYQPNYGAFRAPNEFIHRWNLVEGDWHPGAVKQVKKKGRLTWLYKPNYALDMDGKFTPKLFDKSSRRLKKADIAYLRSGDKKQVIGVITNKTYNLGSTDDCFKWEGIELTSLHTPENVNCSDEELRLRGMKGGKYKIDYYLISNLETPIATSYDRGPKVDIDFEIEASKKGYIVVFVATRL